MLGMHKTGSESCIPHFPHKNRDLKKKKKLDRRVCTPVHRFFNFAHFGDGVTGNTAGDVVN